MVILWLTSCRLEKQNYSNYASVTLNRFDTIGQIKIQEVKLAREICSDYNYSPFCDGSYDQQYRSYPFFVKLNVSDFIHSYDDTVYVLVTQNATDTLKSRGLEFIFPWTMDSLFIGKVSEYNTINYVVSNKWKNQVNTQLRKSNTNKTFNGILSFSLYRMKLKCVYGGRRYIIIPNFEHSPLHLLKVSNIYYIIDIKSIQPIRKEEL